MAFISLYIIVTSLHIAEHFVLHNKGDSMFINEPFSLLAGVHQALLTDPVNYPGNPEGSLPDHIHRNVREQVCTDGSMPAAEVIQTGFM